MSNGLWFLGVLITVILLAVIVFLLNKMRHTNKLKEKAEEALETLELKMNSLRLETLEAKLNPHLFKNILNSIQSHTYQAYYTVDKLSNVLNYVLYETNKKAVSLKDEIAFSKDLIEINKVKLSPLFDLRIKINIDEKDSLYEKDLIAPLISVDLIENAFKHTDIQHPEAFISIVFELKNGVFTLTISNRISEKKKLDKQKSGLGLQTLEQRLNLIYGANFTLDKFVEKNTYISVLKIALSEHKNQMLTT